MHCQRILLAIAFAACAGCASLSGLDSAQTSHTCPVPDGLHCKSLSDIYRLSAANILPTASAKHFANGDIATPQASAALRVVPGPGTAIRSSPRVLRVWVAPWEDSDGDLHDQMHVYVTVDSGRWLIDHNRRAAQKDFALPHFTGATAAADDDPKQSETNGAIVSTADGGGKQ